MRSSKHFLLTTSICLSALTMLVGADRRNRPPVEEKPVPVKPQSPAAVAAMAAFDQAVRGADDGSRKAKLNAVAQLIEKLNEVKREVMKSDSADALDEANRIQAVIDNASNVTAPALAQASPRDLLRQQVAGSKWAWPDPKMPRAWFILEDNGRVKTNWQPKEGLWTVSEDNVVIARIATGDYCTTLVFSADRKNAG